MFSYLHGMRPNGKRITPSTAVPSIHPEVTRPAPVGPEDSEHYDVAELRHTRADSEPFRTTTGHFHHAPVLPPIPRIASQYGFQGVADIQELQERLAQAEASDGIGREVPPVGPRENVAQFNIDELHAYETRHQRWEDKRNEQIAPSLHYPYQQRKPTTRQNEHDENRRAPRRSYTESISTPTNRAHAELLVHSQTQFKQLIASSQPTPTPTSIAPPTTIPTSQSRNSKPMLNRLNPMSLLGRRRTAHGGTLAYDDGSSQRRNRLNAGSTLPDDYDPRIRGKVIHDFSAPRPKPSVLSLDLSAISSNQNHQSGLSDPSSSYRDLRRNDDKRQLSPSSALGSSGGQLTNTDRQHTPVFTEHFGDEFEPWRLDENDRRNKRTGGLIDRMPTEAMQKPQSPLPPFARRFPEAVQELRINDRPIVPVKRALLEAVTEHRPLDTSRQEKPLSTIQLGSPSIRSRVASVEVPSLVPSSLPRHMTSNASRFSFDLAGVGSSAQERLLEERHRQKSSQRKRESALSNVSAMTSSFGGNDDYEDDGYDDMDFDDGYEEKIPGVNADVDEDEEGYPYSIYSGSLAASNNMSNMNLAQQLQPTLQALEVQPEYRSPMMPSLYGDAVPSIGMPRHREDQKAHTVPKGRISSSGLQNAADDELYFDDGIIEDFERGQDPAFDESVFDDENSRIYGLPLRDLKPLPLQPMEKATTTETSQDSTRPISLDSGTVQSNTNTGPSIGTRVTSAQQFEAILPARKSSLAHRAETSAPHFDQTAGLTRDNLAAYHTALAFAANRAAADGRFDRKASIDLTETPIRVAEKSKQRVSFDWQPVSHEIDPPAPLNYPDDTEGFDFDDDLDDDGIIAAANAEALENDDDGFYGHEFGFFAHSNGSDETEYANGGYFGASEGIKRSHSGKDKFQEPSLTPITEQSEWSQRTSMVSLATCNNHAPSSQAVGLAQLAENMEYDDDDMSLSALLKLRRGAWGGSNGSLRSSTGSHKSGSPLSFGFSAPPPANPASGNASNNASNSFQHPSSPPHRNRSYSIDSSISNINEEQQQQPGSPTLRLQIQTLPPLPTFAAATAEKSNTLDSSSLKRSAARGPGHSRTSSGADSISYVKESNLDGEERWVIETRRMAEGGHMEIMGRHLVEGGRI